MRLNGGPWPKVAPLPIWSNEDADGKAAVLQGDQRAQNIATVLRPSTVSTSEPSRWTLAVPKASA